MTCVQVFTEHPCAQMRRGSPVSACVHVCMMCFVIGGLPAGPCAGADNTGVWGAHVARVLDLESVRHAMVEIRHAGIRLKKERKIGGTCVALCEAFLSRMRFALHRRYLLFGRFCPS